MTLALIVTTPGSADTAPAGALKINAAITQVNSTVATVSTVGTGVAAVLTASQLATQYPNPTLNSVVATADGLRQFNGTQWVAAAPFLCNQVGISSILPPSMYVAANGVFIVGQTPAASATVSFSATSGAGVTMTFSAATLLGTSSDNTRILTIFDTTYKYATITAFSSTTVATVTISGGTLSGTGPFANNAIWLSASSTGTTAYSTPFTQIYANAYMYFATGVLYTQNGQTNIGGLYFVQMQSTTVGTAYDNVGLLDQMQIPASKTAIVSAAPGAYTQVTNAGIQLGAANVPANTLGPNGRLNIEWFWTCSNGLSKRCTCQFGGTSIGSSDSETTVVGRSDRHIIQNAGLTNSQITLSSTVGDPGAGTRNTLAIDTTVGQPLLIQGQLDTGSSNAGEWVCLEWMKVAAEPAGLKDFPAAQVFSPAGATILPQGAADLGLTLANLKYFDVPNVSAISTDSTVTAKYYPGLDYQYVANIGPWSNAILTAQSPVVGQGVIPYAQMNNGGLQLTYFGNLISSTATGGSTTTLVDSTQTWVVNAYKGSQLWNDTNSTNVGIASNTATTITLLNATTATIAGNAYRIVSAVPGLATGVGNTQAGSLGLLNSANSWYVEAAIQLNSNHQDHFEAWWMLSQQRSVSSATPYVEIDIHEGGYAADANNPAYCMHTSIINWASGSGGSGTVNNNLSPGLYGPNLNRTRQQVYGMSWNPSTKILQPYLNGSKLPYFRDTTSFFANIQNALYYVIFGPQSHLRFIPYSMWIYYISAWGG